MWLWSRQSHDHGDGKRIHGQFKCSDNQLQELYTLFAEHRALARNRFSLAQSQSDECHARITHCHVNDEKPSKHESRPSGALIPANHLEQLTAIVQESSSSSSHSPSA